jgi:hypothetical protein
MIAEPNQVALLGGYVLAAMIASHLWLNWDREGGWRRSVRPLAWATAAGLIVVVVPLVLCYLYVESSNRPVIEFAEAGLGSLNPASLVTALVADLYGAFDPAVDYWGPYSVYWDKNDLTLSQNMGQLYVGALPIALIMTVGLTRGALWAREMRGYTLSILFLVLYALGIYTPAFRLFYEVLPGVALFRRPADASFLLGGLLAIAGGYVVHLWLNGELRRPGRAGRVIELAIIPVVLVIAIAIAVGEDKVWLAWKPMLNAAGWLVLAMFALVVPMRRFARAGMVAVMVLGVLMTADLAANNGPNESTGGSSANYDILKPNCQNETIKFLKARVRRAPGSQWRDRVELVGLGFEWPNAALIHGLDTTLGYNPLRIGLVSRTIGARDGIAGPDQRTFSRLFPSYRSELANLLGLRFIASSVPIEQVDLKLGRGDLKFLARTRDAYIYENTEALPRVMFVKDWQHANFERIIEEGRWPEFDPTETVLLDGEPEIAGAWADTAWDAEALPDVKIKRYENTIVEIEVSAAADGFVVLNDVWHPWWQAEVDGKPAAIQRANVMFRAVHVAKGKHLVRFEFTPFSGAIAEIGEKLRGVAK